MNTELFHQMSGQIHEAATDLIRIDIKIGQGSPDRVNSELVYVSSCMRAALDHFYTVCGMIEAKGIRSKATLQEFNRCYSKWCNCLSRLAQLEKEAINYSENKALLASDYRFNVIGADLCDLCKVMLELKIKLAMPPKLVLVSVTTIRKIHNG